MNNSQLWTALFLPTITQLSQEWLAIIDYFGSNRNFNKHPGNQQIFIYKISSSIKIFGK